MIDLRDLVIDIEDQRHYNSCGGQAASTYLEAIWLKFTGEKREFSPAFIWQMAKKISGRSGNVGVPVAAVFQVLQDYGCCLESTFPYTDENLARDPPPEALEEAAKYRIKKWKPIKFADLKNTLDKGLPVFAFLDMGGGHFVCVFGYFDMTGFIVVNSWGYEWEDRGTKVMSYDEFDRRFRSAIVVTRVEGLFAMGKRKIRSLFKGLTGVLP